MFCEEILKKRKLSILLFELIFFLVKATFPSFINYKIHIALHRHNGYEGQSF